MAYYVVIVAARLSLHPAGRQSRRTELKELRNIMITMVLGGLWHGANWTFVIWGNDAWVGRFSGAFFAAMRVTASIPHWLCVLITFNFVTVTWAFFRAPNTSRAVQMPAATILRRVGRHARFSDRLFIPAGLVVVFFVLHPSTINEELNGSPAMGARSRMAGSDLFMDHGDHGKPGSSAKFVYFDF